MKRCITCKHWFVSSEPFEGGGCIVSASSVDNAIDRTKPGHNCDKYEVFEPGNDTTQMGLAKSYLFALIGRERCEKNSLAHECFCADVSTFYEQLESQMQINVHDVFRLFLEYPNHRKK